MPLRLTTVVGAILRAGIWLILRVRSPRPIHAHGLVLTGTLRLRDGRAASGVRAIDDAAPREMRVTARLSRSAGLPGRLPDIWGLALRIAPDGADLELSTTGIGVPGRFVLLPRRSPAGGVFSAILPARTPAGPVLFAALADDPAHLPPDIPALAAALRHAPWRLRLCTARPTGRWHPVADLELGTADDQNDDALRFDAVERPLRGTTAYAWAARLRQPSYRLARRS
ncbi:hypothetical protein ACIQLJ_16220 [Microbacterium sp. NPDC091313]